MVLLEQLLLQLLDLPPPPRGESDFLPCSEGIEGPGDPLVESSEGSLRGTSTMSTVTPGRLRLLEEVEPEKADFLTGVSGMMDAERGRRVGRGGLSAAAVGSVEEVEEARSSRWD